MAQAGYTPIQLYYSTTGSQAPTAGNLASGELAINITDGKLYYKDNGGVVQLLASKAGASGDVVGPASATDNAIARFDLTTGKLIKNSGVTIDGSNNVAGVAALTASGNLTLNGGTANGVLYLNGSKVATSGSAITFDGTNFATTGTASATKFIPTGGTATGNGMYLPAANSLGFSTNGAEAFRINSSQNVGIGTSSPGEKLEVNGTALSKSTSGWSVFKTSSTAADRSSVYVASPNGTVTSSNPEWLIGHRFSAQGPLSIWKFDGSSHQANALTLDSSGNLGLGVTPVNAHAPCKSIEYAGGGIYPFTSQINSSFNATLSSPGSWLYIANNTARLFQISQDSFAWLQASSGTAGNAITFTQAMTLDASGNLLVGTTSALNWSGVIPKLQNVGGAFNVLLNANFANDSSPSVCVLAKSRSASVGTYTYPNSSDELGRISFSGAHTGNSRFQEGASVSAFASQTWTSTAQGTYLTFSTVSDGALANTERARITSAGEFWVAGTTDQGAYNIQCNGTGVWGAGAYVNGSDERIKDDITPIDSGLDVVEKLNPVTYRYKEDWSKDQSIQTGFIAQELLVALEGKNYVDGVVQQGGSEGYYSVAYQNIIPILTKAIQELKSELDTVKAELATLKGN